MKNICRMLLCVILVLSLLGCGNPNHKTTEESEDDTVVEVRDKTESMVKNGLAQSGDENISDDISKAAVVYFSGTGNTIEVANVIASETGADIYEIIPAEKYSDEDLNYNDDNCRANIEMNDESARPEIESDLSAVVDYDIIYLGHPIWWGTAPRIIQTFLEKYDVSKATIYTFCTSGGSGIEKSISDLQSAYPELNIAAGKRFSDVAEDDVKEWIESLKAGRQHSQAVPGFLLQ